jgi:hypothetical protein
MKIRLKKKTTVPIPVRPEPEPCRHCSEYVFLESLIPAQPGYDLVIVDGDWETPKEFGTYRHRIHAWGTFNHELREVCNYHMGDRISSCEHCGRRIGSQRRVLPMGTTNSLRGSGGPLINLIAYSRSYTNGGDYIEEDDDYGYYENENIVGVYPHDQEPDPKVVQATWKAHYRQMAEGHRKSS